MSEPELNTPSVENPQVSVIIPAYNAAGHIASALESVFAQRFSSYEIIVINDGSPDTPQLLEVLRPYMGRIRYLEQHNQGPSAARNNGINAARGADVSFLDSDDCWWPPYREEQVRLLEGPPRRDLV